MENGKEFNNLNEDNGQYDYEKKITDSAYGQLKGVFKTLEDEAIKNVGATITMSDISIDVNGKEYNDKLETSTNVQFKVNIGTISLTMNVNK